MLAVLEARLTRRPRYRIVFDRDHDAAGYVVNLADMRASGRESIFTAFVNSAEFLDNPSLKDRASFVGRVYQQLLRRAPTPGEVSQVLQVHTPARIFLILMLLSESQELRRQRCATRHHLDGVY